MSEEKVNSIDGMKYNRLIWNICGVWSPKSKPIWYKIYSMLLYVVVFILFPISLLSRLFFIEDFDEVIDNMLPSLSVALVSVKALNVYLRQDIFYELFELMEKMDESIRLPEQKRLVRQAIRKSQNISILGASTYNTALLLAFVAVFINSERILLWPSSYPFDWRTNDVNYYLILIYQIISNGIVCFVDGTVDTFGAGLSIILGSHIDAIKIQLKVIICRKRGVDDGKKLTRDGDDLNKKLDCFNDKEDAAEDSAKNLANCINDHKRCIKFSAILDRILTYAYLVQFTFSIVIICLCVFKLSDISPSENISKFMFVIIYLLCMTIEIFVPCYFGTVVTLKSAELTYSLFEVNWIEQSMAFKRSLIIFVERTLKPIKPFVGGLFLLGLPTFLTIMRSAYSLLALLKNVQREYGN